MKGITPVISIILLLMIAIAIIGFAFYWFTSVSKTAQSETDKALQQTKKQINTAAIIDNIDSVNNQTAIKNIGTETISINELIIYVDNALIASTSCPGTALAAGKTVTCTNSTINGCSTIRITTIGSGDEKSC
ncbi:MAG TPA: archaellin/type IV pilin N-terminal domain-containing protein [archaeon]|nr:archaellin/type IV pilin N-terminal domain-containing protein [archaeon]